MLVKGGTDISRGRPKYGVFALSSKRDLRSCFDNTPLYFLTNKDYEKNQSFLDDTILLV